MYKIWIWLDLYFIHVRKVKVRNIKTKCAAMMDSSETPTMFPVTILISAVLRHGTAKKIYKNLRKILRFFMINFRNCTPEYQIFINLISPPFTIYLIYFVTDGCFVFNLQLQIEVSLSSNATKLYWIGSFKYLVPVPKEYCCN